MTEILGSNPSADNPVGYVLENKIITELTKEANYIS